MNKYDDIKKEITELVIQGDKLYKALAKDEAGICINFPFFLSNYEAWYSKSIVLVKHFSPERASDFILLYKDEKRKELTQGTYTLSDALRNLSYSYRYSPATASSCLIRQVQIIQSCLAAFDSGIYKIQSILQADIFDSELDSAKHLLKMGFLRAAGAICGVVLEKHFSGIAETHNIKMKKKEPTIADYNDAFKDNVYDTIEWRKIQHLGDIRNLCDHKKDREPTKDEVEELISGADRVIKNIF